MAQGTTAIVIDADGEQRYIVVSADGHAGGSVPDYRPRYCDWGDRWTALWSDRFMPFGSRWY